MTDPVTIHPVTEDRLTQLRIRYLRLPLAVQDAFGTAWRQCSAPSDGRVTRSEEALATLEAFLTFAEQAEVKR